jgi:hypothetical protein
MELLDFPEWCQFPNKAKMRGEELFLRGLYELVSGSTKHIICKTVFGGECSRQSRAFTFFIDYLYQNFKQLVENNLAWWYRNEFLETSADAIEKKMISSGYSSDAIIFYRVACFIDCNCLPTSVAGGGLAEEGANAMRWNESIQRAFYNG